MLWVARDDRNNSTDCWLFWGKPKITADGVWVLDSYSQTILIPASASPAKLRPGDGPVRVKLTEEEGK